MKGSMAMTRLFFYTIATLVTSSVLLMPVHAGWLPNKKDQPTSEQEVEETIAQFLQSDQGLQEFFDQAYGYAVFPKIYKGAIGVGGAYGSGQVYEKGKYIGKSKLYQLTYGLQLGGQAYAELIFFGDEDALNRFIQEKAEFSAQISAVAATAGASTDADYSNGVAVFTLTVGGLMYEASVGGQTFEFTPATE
jgi:lipid-binding SYLF domain-containing protein